jgi:hypothetical protein
MNEDMNRTPDASDGELKAALRSAVSPPVGEVDWDRLHGRILAAAASRRGITARPKRASDWVAAWSRRGIPALATARAAAVVALLVLPLDRRAAEPEPPGFWPIAEELVSGLPEATRRLLLAGDDVESLLQAVMANGREERDIS